MTPLFISPKLHDTFTPFAKEDGVNVAVNISLTKYLNKREIPHTNLKATNKIFVIDFMGADVSWHFSTPENRDQIYSYIQNNNFEYFVNEPIYSKELLR